VTGIEGRLCGQAAYIAGFVDVMQLNVLLQHGASYCRGGWL